MSRTVLVVEDEAPIREMLKFVLEQSGFNIIEAEDFDIAQEKICEPYPDLILLDWMLPDISGVEVCKNLKKVAHRAPLNLQLLVINSARVSAPKICSIIFSHFTNFVTIKQRLSILWHKFEGFLHHFT